MLHRYQSLTEYLTAFAGFLRDRNYLVGITEVTNALQCLEKIDIGDHQAFGLVLKINFTSSTQQWKDFEAYRNDFEKEYQKGIDSKIKGDKIQERNAKSKPDRKKYHIEDIKKWLYQIPDKDTLEAPFFSTQQSNSILGSQSFDDGGSLELDQCIARLLHRLANKSGRNRLRNVDRGIIDLHSLLRNRFRRGDELVKLNFLRIKKEKSKIVFFCDVSRSMEWYSRFLNALINQLPNHIDHYQVVLFNTMIHLVEKKDIQDRSWLNTPGLWTGGTRIGKSLQQWLELAPDWIDRRTTVLIFSDGWDTGDLDLLQHSMYTMQRKSRKVIWLNPTLKSKESRQISGMQTAIPYVDLLAPVYNLATLQDLTRMI